MRLQDIIPDTSFPTEKELNIIKSIFNGSITEPPKRKEDFVNKNITVDKPTNTNASKFTMLFAFLVTFVLLLNKPVYSVLRKINVTNLFVVTLIQVLLSVILFYSAIKLLKF